VLAFGESKYFPAGTTWTEVTGKYGWYGRDTSTYVVKDEMPVEGVIYNAVYRNDEQEPYCLLREEGPLVYMWINEYENGLLYDFDWWEGKEYMIDFPGPFGEEFYHDVINKIDEIVLEDGQTYQIWTPYNFDEGDYIICGIGATNGIFKYFWPIPTGGGGETCLLEFTREVRLYNKDNATDRLKVIGTDNQQKSTRPIRLKRNETGGYDLQVKNSDGNWQNVK
jgi:hypothetical protein